MGGGYSLPPPPPLIEEPRNTELYLVSFSSGRQHLEAEVAMLVKLHWRKGIQMPPPPPPQPPPMRPSRATLSRAHGRR